MLGSSCCVADQKTVVLAGLRGCAARSSGSTGKIGVSATLEAAETMLRAIAASSRPVGFKAAGGIRTLEQAAEYLALADRVLGPQWAGPRTFRFGASGLLDDLLGRLGQGGGAADASGY